MGWLVGFKSSLALAAVAGLMLAAGLPAGAQPAALPRPPAADDKAPQGPRFNGAILIEAAGGAYRDTLNLNRMLDEIKRSPFTDVIVQVRAYGDAYYDSKIVPRAYGLTANSGENESFDPLKIIIKELKGDPANPRRVYASIETLRVANASRALPDPDTHVTKAHPNWLTRNQKLDIADADGNVYLEPGLPAVQEHLEAIAAELVGNYKIDGLVVEGLRYPGTEGEWGYHEDMIERWRQTVGSPDRPAPSDAKWGEMRREALHDVMRRIQTAALRVNPNAQVIAVALAEGPAPRNPEEFKFTRVYQGADQDWPTWMANKLVGGVILKNYRREGQETDAFNAWNAFGAQMVKATGIEVLPAIAGYENISIDALTQMKRVREGGFSGVAVSNLRDLILDSASKEIFYRALANSVLSSRSSRVPFEHAAQLGEVSADALVVALAAAPAPAPAPNAASSGVSGAAAPGETAPGDHAAQAGGPAPVPDEGVGPAPRPSTQAGGDFDRLNELLEPAPGSVEYLKRRFKNIF